MIPVDVLSILGGWILVVGRALIVPAFYLYLYSRSSPKPNPEG